MDLVPIVRGRYQNDSRRALSQFLKHYLAADHAALFRRWNGVGLMFEYPALAPEESLDQPRVVIAEPRDEVQRTFMTSSQTQHYGEWHQLEFEVFVLTDGETGSTITGSDLAGAIELILADHSGELEAIGLNLMEKTSEPGTTNPDTGLLEKVVRVKFDLQVMGAAIRTLELEVGRWQFTATGQGAFAAGLTLDVAHKLRVQLLTGTGTNATALTITALNEAGQARSLTAMIPPTRSAGTMVSVVDEDASDEYTSVTNIAVTPGSGLPGEAFAVKNIPKELGG